MYIVSMSSGEGGILIVVLLVQGPEFGSTSGDNSRAVSSGSVTRWKLVSVLGEEVEAGVFVI